MASFPKTDWIWRDGEFIPWEQATIHVMSHVVHYGSSVFEGIRCYNTPEGPSIFRLKEHVRRLQDSAKVYRMDAGFSAEQIGNACGELILKNGLEECYLRPIIFRGLGAAGLNPNSSPVQLYIVCWPWGTYLGEGALEQGVDACVSSWYRPAPNTHPAMAKAGGNYSNSQLIKMEALTNGYQEGIALSPSGNVSEGSGQNIFLVRNGTLITPATDGTLLEGITRDCIMRVARDLGIPVSEQPVPREMLYMADEVFFTGTAAEVTPVRSVDRIVIGEGKAGPMTKQLQERLLGIALGKLPDAHGWRTLVRSTGKDTLVA
ncbi:MAG: branched-chain amino acid transaminase [Gemmatimonadota bacterium]|jgi:branched-chain amino acid aminotransferase|nr:branched-chain amino acid transaminase [Gemmatimonadota bacterium]